MEITWKEACNVDLFFFGKLFLAGFSKEVSNVAAAKFES